MKKMIVLLLVVTMIALAPGLVLAGHGGHGHGEHGDHGHGGEHGHGHGDCGETETPDSPEASETEAEADSGETEGWSSPDQEDPEGMGNI